MQLNQRLSATLHLMEMQMFGEIRLQPKAQLLQHGEFQISRFSQWYLQQAGDQVHNKINQ